jgi:prostaglandin-endoperoxide synthase 2
VPPTFRIANRDVDLQETTMFRTKELLTGRKLGPLFDDASRQAAGKVCLRNTGDPLLWRAELPSIEAAREVRLRSYNDYLTRYKFPRVTTFEEISSDPKLVAALRATYDDVDDVEFYVGLFAADQPKHSILSPLMERMLAIHAFFQLMTNPLLAPEVYTAETFSVQAWR